MRNLAVDSPSRFWSRVRSWLTRNRAVPLADLPRPPWPTTPDPDDWFA